MPKPLASLRVLELARILAGPWAGLMLADVVWERGVELEVLANDMLAGEIVERLSREQIEAVFISALPPQAGTHARYLAKRLRARFPELRIVVGLWEAGGSVRKARERANRERDAQENRIKFGQTKSERNLFEAKTRKWQNELDGSRRQPEGFSDDDDIGPSNAS